MESMKLFLNFRELPEFFNLRGLNHPIGPLAYGLLGNSLPLFRLSDSLLGRILGHTMINLSQEEWNQSLVTDLAVRAKTAAAGYHFGPNTVFQKNAFGVFAAKCRSRHAVLIVCCGQLNPILSRALDPALRLDMLAFLHGQAALDTNIVLLEQSQMPVQTEQDYDDLTHVNKAAQVQFSEFMAGILDNLMSTNHPAQHAAR
jgi:hypothetical protein